MDPLSDLIESLHKTSKGQLSYARDPLSACPTIDSNPCLICPDSKISGSHTVLLEQFRKLELPSKTNNGSLILEIGDSSRGNRGSQKNSTDGSSLKQMKWNEIALLPNNVNTDEATPVYNMSFEMMLQLFEEKAAPQNQISTDIINKYKELEETTRLNRQKCEQRRKELESRLVPRSQTQSDMDHTLQRLQARAILSRQKQNDLLESRIRDIQSQSEREQQKMKEENERRALEKQRSDAYQRRCLCAQQIDKSWKTVIESISGCADKDTLSQPLQPIVHQMKELKINFEAIEKEMLTSTQPMNDAGKCEDIEKEFKKLSQSILDIIKTINDEFKNKEALKKQQIAEENAAKAQAKIKEQENENQEEDNVDFVHKEDFLLYTVLQNELEQHQAVYANVSNDPSLKQFKFDCQKAVNVPVNAISPQSAQHLQDKLDKLLNLLRGNFIEVPPRRFKATQHPGGIEYCADLLARKLVRQGEDVVSSNPEAAFAIAAVINALWSEFPTLGRLILAHFYKTCPYLVPYCAPQQEGQSDQDYYKALGYQYSNGVVEKQDKFLKRMSGVVRLYAAVIVSVPRVRQQQQQQQQQQQAHPFGLVNGWKYLAATMNLKPRLEITATVLFNFLEVAGHRLSQAYGRQFIKLLHLLCTDYFALIRSVTPDGCGGPVVRLDDFLQKTLKKREIAPPAGQLPARFW